MTLYHFTLVRMAIVKKPTKNKCRRGCSKKETFPHCWWECKLVATMENRSLKTKIKLHLTQESHS